MVVADRFVSDSIQPVVADGHLLSHVLLTGVRARHFIKRLTGGLAARTPDVTHVR